MTPRPGRKITPQVRNRFQFLTAAATGVAAFGTLAGTGLVTGQVAAAYDQENARKAEAAARQAADAARQAAAQTPVVITKRRPHRTVVRTVVVNQASSTWAATPSSGGTIRQSTSRPTSHTTSHSTRPSTGTSRPSRPAPAPKPAPRPAPKPAPSSGS